MHTISAMEKGEINHVAKWNYEVRKFKSVDEILNFAINREIDAQTFYVKIAELVENPKLSKIFLDLALEELEHKTKLEAFKSGTGSIGEKEIENLTIIDYAMDLQPHSKMTHTELLVVGIKKEETSRKLYAELATIAHEKEFKNTFIKLAREEAEHKLRFEREYNQTTPR